jgi:hypothetical protein
VSESGSDLVDLEDLGDFDDFISDTGTLITISA